jgi:hypothetical protein
VTSGRTPWWRHRQRERFARAVDSLPEQSQAPDPKLAGELAVVVMLRRGAAATAPDDAARDRMRAKLLGEITPSPPTPSPRPSPVPRTGAPGRPPGPSGSTRPGRGRVTGTRGRVAIALGAAFCLVLALSGMTLLLSRHALPGDPLYGVRRTVESAALGLTSGDDGKGTKHLEYAADRIGDIQSLAAKYPDAQDSPVGDYLTAFADFDTDARAGTADLTGYATDHGDGPLTALRTWAAQETERIKQVESRLPEPAATQAAHSVALLARITQRANALAARDACYTITSGATDDLGVLPATGRCDTAPNAASGGAVPSAAAGSTVLGRAPTVTDTVPPGGTRGPVQPPATITFTAPPPVLSPPILGTGATGAPTTTTAPPNTVTLPLPLPPLRLPPLLPGLPGIQIGQ